MTMQDEIEKLKKKLENEYRAYMEERTERIRLECRIEYLQGQIEILQKELSEYRDAEDD